jgi:AcrR family transcriptional regulator
VSPRTPRQFEAIRAASVNKILDAALELFGTTGYENTSMAQIAKKANISKGLIYNYFDSKEDLLKALIDRLTTLGEDQIKHMIVEDPRATLRHMLTFTFKWLKENEKMNRLLFSLTLQVERFEFIHNMANAKMKKYVVLLEHLLEQMKFPNHKTEARILATLFDGIAIQFLVLKEDYPLDEIEAMLIKKYCS